MRGPLRTVLEVLDGERVRLDDGTTLRLAGILAPLAPLNHPSGASWPPGEAAKRALARLVAKRSVRLYFAGRRRDRYGNMIAHLVLPSPDKGKRGAWVQAGLLAAGMVRAYSLPQNRACMPALYARERLARLEGLGLWSNAAYQLRKARRAKELLAFAHTFQIVVGRVKSVEGRGKRVFLNFGDDWKTDFTVAIDARARLSFLKRRIDPKSFAKRRIRVRGWIERSRGPLIRVSHPEQIEILQ